MGTDNVGVRSGGLGDFGQNGALLRFRWPRARTPENRDFPTPAIRENGGASTRMSGGRPGNDISSSPGTDARNVTQFACLPGGFHKNAPGCR